MGKSSKKVRPIDLEKAIMDVIRDSEGQAYEVLEDSVREVAWGAADKLKSVKKFAPGRNPSGEYSKSWTVELKPKERLKVAYVVHNEEHYRLTHLLENGHVSRNGTGRTFGRVKAYPHIQPVNEWAKAELRDVVEQKLMALYGT